MYVIVTKLMLCVTILDFCDMILLKMRNNTVLKPWWRQQNNICKSCIDLAIFRELQYA